MEVGGELESPPNGIEIRPASKVLELISPQFNFTLKLA